MKLALITLHRLQIVDPVNRSDITGTSLYYNLLVQSCQIAMCSSVWASKHPGSTASPTQ